MKAFLVGVGIGVGVGMLFAPESGEVSRRKLRARVTEWSESLGRTIDEAKDRFQEFVPTENKIEEPLPPRKDQAKAQSPSESTDPINTMTREELMNVNGIGQVLADKVISSRPYGSPRDVVDRGILPLSTFEELERELKNRPKRSA
jgi:DNA uptake protein ComE-like DNA-binding protein